MRILLISAFYPPQVVGGWEQLVQDINLSLQDRGHETLVLTSTHGVQSSAQIEPGVLRQLALEADLVRYRPADFFLYRAKRLRHNLDVLTQAVQSFRPDVIFVHVMWNLSKRIAWQAEKLLPGRVVYYIANDWPHAINPHRVYWLDPARGPRRWMKKLVAPLAMSLLKSEERVALKFEHVLTVSQAVRKDLARQAGIPLGQMQVVYNGVELDLFTPRLPGSHQQPDGRLRLLYAGTMALHKGVHTAIEAMALLAQKPELEPIDLTLVGSGHPDYEARLRGMVASNGLEQRVTFRSRVGREQMPALLREFDVLIFPSTWEEPLARMTQEAMACGLLVIGTPTGGTPEILVEGETGLTFPPGDAVTLATQIEKIYCDPDLKQRLVANAHRKVEAHFDFKRMVDEIETYLAGVIQGVEEQPFIQPAAVSANPGEG